ncbi:MAG: DUF6789 family protein [Ktedonobacteraceae bacterium]
MSIIIQRVCLQPWRWRRAASAGVLATVAYTIAMEGDMALTGNRFNDIRFIQGMIGGKEAQKKRFSILAWTFHLLNGALLGEVYAAIFKRFLPGPNWLRGAIFGELFIVSAWWLTPIADKHHPMIKNGELPKLATWTSFLQNIVRHFIFGVTLGLLYRDEKS